MRKTAIWLLMFAAAGLLVACESAGSGHSESSASSYYGVAFTDPWYYGDSYYPSDGVVRPPPDGSVGAHPEHPIVTPPGSSGASPRPMPSIPSTPRPSFHR